MQAATNVDQRFLSYFSGLLLCSRCLRSGVRTPLPQIISPRHKPRSLCRDCRAAGARSAQ